MLFASLSIHTSAIFTFTPTTNTKKKMKTPVLIVIIASVVVLCTLPALYVFLAYHTYRERQRWKVDHDMALDKMEAEGRRNPRAASAASHSISSSSGLGRAPSAQHSHHRQQQSSAPARPAPAHNPRWAPPRPPRELDVFKSSRDHLSSQADAAPRAVPQGSGRSINRPAPGSTTTRKSSGAGKSSRASGKQKQQQQQQQEQRPSSSAVGAGCGNMAPSEEQLSAIAVAKEEEAGKDDYQGNEELAQKLLKPRRRAQIDVWVGETVSRWEAQRCAAGRKFGHRSDPPTPSAMGQPGLGPRSAPPVDGDDCICPVCGRPFDDKKPVVTQPERAHQQPDGAKPGKGKHMIRGIRAAMGHLKARDGGRGGEKGRAEEGWDRALSTQMFLADASEYGSSTDTNHSSFPFGGGDNKELGERMARLRRVQKLLDRSQPGGEKARCTEILL
ncbi:hypothetical protein INS49_008331 [Diaporthe citri]|uniref:uncharacterized protein n=1 Tax=Diaporthe citri TaxID=83186 RepID=UPI001C7FCFB6|nr:uncharacterized protein INS49_008331 [Diaporthe citri]KAG6363235.1 hypothetical protein INS49_008331 [Diaporthe citri]